MRSTASRCFPFTPFTPHQTPVHLCTVTPLHPFAAPSHPSSPRTLFTPLRTLSHPLAAHTPRTTSHPSHPLHLTPPSHPTHHLTPPSTPILPPRSPSHSPDTPWIRWAPAGLQLADGLTKDKGEAVECLRRSLRSGSYVLRSEEQVMHERQLSRTSKKREEKSTVEQS